MATARTATTRRCSKAADCPVGDCWARNDHVCHPTKPTGDRAVCRSTGWLVRCEPVVVQ